MMDAQNRSRRWWSRYGLLAIFIAVTVLPSVVLLVHVGAAGVGVPYQDPTPQQAAYQSYHKEISFWIIDLVLGGWMVGAVIAIACLCRWVFQRRAK